MTDQPFRRDTLLAPVACRSTGVKAVRVALKFSESVCRSTPTPRLSNHFKLALSSNCGGINPSGYGLRTLSMLRANQLVARSEANRLGLEPSTNERACSSASIQQFQRPAPQTRAFDLSVRWAACRGVELTPYPPTRLGLVIYFLGFLELSAAVGFFTATLLRSWRISPSPGRTTLAKIHTRFSVDFASTE